MFYPGWSSALYWITSLVAAVLLFLSVLLHELAHSLVARRRGLQVKNITLFIFGGVSNIEQEPTSPGIEFQMTVVGPVTSLVLGGIFFLLLLPLRGVNSPVAAILGYLGLTNVLLGVFNLLPGFPLDGGRVLRSIIWKVTGNLHRATRVAVIVGEVLAYLFILVGLWLFFIGDILDGVWFGFIGWYLLTSARSANTQDMLQTILRGVTVAEVMTPSPPTVPANISLQRLVDEYFLPQGLRSALVTQGDLLAGLITLGDIRHVAREAWPSTPVGQIMIPLERLHVVAPGQNLNEVLPLMVVGDVNQLPVVQDGRILGVMSREALMRYLEVRRSLGYRNSDTPRRAA